MIWLLDTNIVIHALNGVPTVRDRLNAAADSDRTATSTIVVVELIYGAECSTRREESSFDSVNGPLVNASPALVFLQRRPWALGRML